MGGINGFFISILEGIHSFVGNYGWSVVVFTLFVRMLVLPLDIKSRRGMRAMTRVQPKMAALQKSTIKSSRNSTARKTSSPWPAVCRC